MPVRAPAGSRNSSRRCASPREIRTPGRWRRNRLVHSSMSNRRLPRSNAPRNRRKPHSRRPWRAPSVSINKEIELGVRGRWPPLSECTICSDPASQQLSLAGVFDFPKFHPFWLSDRHPPPAPDFVGSPQGRAVRWFTSEAAAQTAATCAALRPARRRMRPCRAWPRRTVAPSARGRSAARPG